MEKLTLPDDDLTQIDTDICIFSDDEFEIWISLLLQYERKEGTFSLTLQLPHTDYSEIVPDDPLNCSIYTPPTDPSTLDELPDHISQQFREAIEQVKAKYNVKEKTNDPIICNFCTADSSSILSTFGVSLGVLDDGTIIFSRLLTGKQD